MHDDTPSLAPLSDEAWPASAAHLLSGFAGRLNVYRVMAHNPALLIAWETLRNHVVLQSALTSQQSEIVILRVGVRKQSRYEWMHHVLRGLDAGLTPHRISATRATPPASLENNDSVLIAAVDAIIDCGHLPQALLCLLTGQIGAAAVFDVIATVGMYVTLACILETYAVPAEDDIVAAFATTPFASSA